MKCSGKILQIFCVVIATFFTIFVSTQNVYAETYLGTLSISNNGGNCYLAGIWDGETNTCTLTKDVQGAISVSSGITIDGNGHSLIPGVSKSIVGIYPSSNVTIKNFSLISAGSYGVYISKYVNNIKILNNHFSGSYCSLRMESSDNLVDGNQFELGNSGLQLYGSSNNIITNNLFSNSYFGISLEYSKGNKIIGNTIENNRSYGLYAFASPLLGNYVVNNNFINNGNGQTNGHNVEQMSDALPIGGNYWSNYDETKEGCEDINKDYICDKPKYANPFTKIYGDFLPWTIRDGWKGGQEPDQFFTKLSFGEDGVHYMYEHPSATSLKIKQLPNDWIVKVVNKKDEIGGAIISDGYKWYRIEDINDQSFGWVIAASVTDSGDINKTYITYEAEKQIEYENITTQILASKESRVNKIIEIINHYYDDTNTSRSLYSGNDGVLNFSLFKEKGFPKELLLAIIAQESGIIDFNNEFVSYDYGHGAMQITFQAWFNEPLNYQNNKWDNRGKFSDLKNLLCNSIILNEVTKKREAGSDQYKKCYKNTETQNKLSKPYKYYDNAEGSSLYKQYTNTEQSLYANIKDGLGSLREKYSKKCPKADIQISGYTFSCEDIEKILMVWGYNGFGYDKTKGKYIGDYLKSIAYRLENIQNYFTGQQYNNSDNFIQKLRIANDNRKVIKLFSPVDLHIYDSQGNRTGMFDDQIFEEIPNSSYDYDQEGSIILFPESSLKFEIAGKSNNTYGIRIDSMQDGQQALFLGTGLEIHKDEIHTYTIDTAIIASGGKGVHIEIDTDGDGVIERSLDVGLEIFDLTPPDINIVLQKEEFILGESTELIVNVTDNKDVDIDPQVYLNDELVTDPTINLDKPGKNTLKVVATDNTGNTQTEEKIFYVRYIFNGFLPPLVDGNIYKGDRVIPVMFTISDIFQNKVLHQEGVVVIRGYNIEKIYNTREEGNSGKYEAPINLSEVPQGDYSIIALLNDGSQHFINIKR